MEAFHNAVTAVLTIRGAAKAVAFYERAFGAEEIYRNTYPDGRIVAELAVGEARFRVADEAPEVGNLSPEALGGTSVRLNLLVADPDGVAAVAIANGAIEVAPVADQSYGLRQGRLADPFGHHWLIGGRWPAPPATGRGRPRGSRGVAGRLPCAGPGSTVPGGWKTRVPSGPGVTRPARQSALRTARIDVKRTERSSTAADRSNRHTFWYAVGS